VLPLLRRLAGGFDGNGATDHERALLRLRRVTHPGSLVLLIGDLAGSDSGRLAPHLADLARHNEVVLIDIHDPVERAPLPAGRYPVCAVDANGATRFSTIHSDHRFGAAWQEQVDRYRQQWRSLCRRLAIHDLAIATSDDPLPRLVELFGRANRQRGR
jgi:hypothetical protein